MGTFQRAHTSASLIGSESSYSLTSLNSFDLCTPLMSPASTIDEKTRVLDSFVASVGECPKTTVMIRGIPKNYDQEMLLAEVQAVGLPVNFLYVPPGKTKANRSYGFVNFETESAAERFLYSFQGHQWCQTDATKFADIGLATLQGYEQNLEFFPKQEVPKGVSKRSPWVKPYLC